MLMQRVLAVLALWSQVLLVLWLPASSRNLKLHPRTCICFLRGPLDTCLDLLPPASLPAVQRRGAQARPCNTREHAPISRRFTRDQPEVVLIDFSRKHRHPRLSGTKSRIANRTIPRLAGLESPKNPQGEAKKRVESQQSRIAENRFRVAI